MGGTAIFMTIATIHGAAIPGFDNWHQSVSALALGPSGWIQGLNFAVFGVVVLSSAPAWRQVLTGTTGATWFPALTATLGISFVAAAFIPQDPAPGYDPAGLALQGPTSVGLIHLAVAAVAAASSLGTVVVLAARFASDSHWRGWAIYSVTVAAATTGCIAVYAVWSTRPDGLAGTFERMAVTLPALWMATVVARLWAGVPFMRSAHTSRIHTIEGDGPG